MDQSRPFQIWMGQSNVYGTSSDDKFYKIRCVFRKYAQMQYKRLYNDIQLPVWVNATLFKNDLVARAYKCFESEFTKNVNSGCITRDNSTYSSKLPLTIEHLQDEDFLYNVLNDIMTSWDMGGGMDWYASPMITPLDCFGANISYFEDLLVCDYIIDEERLLTLEDMKLE
jgi:hypothetical protein